ncbi:MAG: CarD family transcriptional regulator, partial [Clostridia bacterium]|nr:CarD family transcriptional regulator [Clostridia bacterium]
RDEIDSLLLSVAAAVDEWIESDRERKEFFTSTIRSGDRLALLQMIRTLCLHRARMKDEKKHFHVTDERFLREAENLLHDEFAFSLGISRAEVSEYINERIELTS